MDHVLDAMQVHYEAYLDSFMEEQRAENYKKFADNPCYEEIKVLINSMNIIRKHLGLDTVTLKQEVEFYLED